MCAAPSFHLFGPPVLEWPGKGRLVFLPQRPFHTLAYLACRDTWVPRDTLANWLWPDHDLGQARRNLRKVLAQARALIGTQCLEQQGDCVRWQVASDLKRFETACAAQDAGAVLSLFGPPLMQGLETGLSPAALDWLAAERVRLAHRWREAALKQLASQAADRHATIALCERMLALDGFDEDALAALTAALEGLGRRADALRMLDGHAVRLRAQLEIEPSAALRSARDRIAGAPLTAAATTPAHRASTDDGFVGRRGELLQLTELLMRPACRVLTISGPGGIGKTRLAGRAAEALAPRFPDGVLSVSAADLDSAADVGLRFATALALKLKGDTDLWPQVGDAVGARHMLWVLDGTEHLPDLGGPLASLLAGSPGLKLVNTSRSRLGITGEWFLPLEGLPLPDADEFDPEVLRTFDAVRLFESRARAAQPSFRLEDEAAALVALLEAVDGMPLAIELAAPWVRLLRVTEILEEIRRSPDMLGEPVSKSGTRGLRDSFEQSWRLLAVEERTALWRLAAMPAEFDREMAHQVAGAGLPLLASLADKSLLQARPHGRFGLHPMLRDYALEQAPDLEEMRQRHAVHVGRWLERLAEQGGDSRWIELGRSLTHARSAWQWAVARRAADVVSAAARPLMLFFESQGLWSEGLDLLAHAAAAFDGERDADPRASCVVWRCLGTLQYRAGRLAGAEASARRSLRLARRLRDVRAIKSNLNTIGLSLWLRGHFADAQPYFRDALRLAERDADAPGIAVFRGNLAMVETALGHYPKAQALHELILAQGSEKRPPQSLATTLNNAANTRRALGRYEAAAALLAQALQMCDRHDLHSLRPYVVVNMGALEVDRGRQPVARRWLDQALSATGAPGEPAIRIEALLWMVVLDLDEADPGAAAAHLSRAMPLVNELQSTAMHLRWLMVFVRWCVVRRRDVDAAMALQWVDRQPGLSALDRADALRRLPPRRLAALAKPLRPPPADGTPEGVLAWAGELLDAHSSAARATPA